MKDLDRFEMITQAFQYEKREKKPGLLQEFFDSTQGKYNHQHEYIHFVLVMSMDLMH